ncbi:nuclear transport factor 2 family protein [Amycolatopsis taiwanensis]|uniref:SnoaL-like domain-containing protein n=1 Tax=Amycolatopsis taiwanensis TaxID=342230 RepID=A0A9W6QXL1_9PSEU|nr:nuclear transport factor 2 family protein [Amycolatopsis taiwanensis]GLY65414.1 hypothetical protein Atai01_20330 [Amycolatopsis taiwanensis]
MSEETRLARLEQRVQWLTDQLAISQLIASYGPLVDAGDADGVAALWAEDGEYDVEGWHMRSRDDVRAMVRSDSHQEIINGGSCHFLGPAHVTVDGDDAVAVCDSILVRRRNGGFEIDRAGASHFVLKRLPEGWRVLRRTTRLLNGGVQARGLLEAGVRGRPL